jgi:hypothetical protein
MVPADFFFFTCGAGTSCYYFGVSWLFFFRLLRAPIFSFFFSEARNTTHATNFWIGGVPFFFWPVAYYFRGTQSQQLCFSG